MRRAAVRRDDDATHVHGLLHSRTARARGVAVAAAGHGERSRSQLLLKYAGAGNMLILAVNALAVNGALPLLQCVKQCLIHCLYSVKNYRPIAFRAFLGRHAAALPAVPLLRGDRRRRARGAGRPCHGTRLRPARGERAGL